MCWRCATAQLHLNQIQNTNFDSKKEIRIKVTRSSEYGERCKLFVIEKNSFDESFTLEDYGIDLIEEKNLIVVDNMKWNGLAKKSGIEIGDFISEFKIENNNRPNKNYVYPIAILLLLIVGFYNYRKKI